MEKRGPKPKRKEVVWSPELAYAVGLIATDGCLSSDKRHLTLVSKDIEQLKNLKKCLALGAKISAHASGKKGGHTPYRRIQWSDVTLYKFLLDIGLTPRKSLTLGAIKVPDTLFFDFLRGSFDGDGCFYSYLDPRWKKSYMYYLSFSSASPRHVEWLRLTIKRLAGIHGHLTSPAKSCVQNIRFAKREALILIKLLYDKEGPYLSRKRLKIERALRIVGESLEG